MTDITWPNCLQLKRAPRVGTVALDSSYRDLVNDMQVRTKMVRIFFERILDRICLEKIRSVHIRVQIFNIRYRIRIRILKYHIYYIDIESYPIRYG
jgi:hypothetical protein